MSACCGACVAVTSCDTSELTLMTEPPAAPALELLATDTGLEVEVMSNQLQCVKAGASRRPPSLCISLRQLLQERHDVLRDRVGLGDHRRAGLLQNLRLRQGGGRRSVVRVHDLAL